MTRLLASDLDGTLLQTGGTISQTNVDAIARATSSGLDVVFVTGRPPRWMQDISEMTGHTGQAICANGSVVIDLESLEIISADLIDPEVGLEAARRLREIDPGISFAVELARTELDFLVDHNYRPRWEVSVPPPRVTVEEMFATGLVTKFLARPSEDAVHDADTFLTSAYEVTSDIVDVTHSDIFDVLVEMSLLGINKGSGLARLAAARGFGADQVAAVGDMPNDVPMIKWAGRGAAVANAHAWVKEVANEHLPSNDEHAVSILIDRILNND